MRDFVIKILVLMCLAYPCDSIGGVTDFQGSRSEGSRCSLEVIRPGGPNDNRKAAPTAQRPALGKGQNTHSIVSASADKTPPITITFPKANDTVFIGGTVKITWEGYTPGWRLKIDLFHQGSYNRYVGQSSGLEEEKEWRPATYPGMFTPGDGYQLRISYEADTGCYIMSDPFVIEYSEVTWVAWPNSDVKHFFGDTIKIGWCGKDSVGEDVSIDLYRGDDYVMRITDATPNDGTYAWVVPHLGQEGQFRIRVTDVTTHRGSVMGDLFFLGDVPNYIMTAPKTGDVFQWGEQIDIRWKKERLTISDVRIQLYQDGTLVQTIDSLTNNDGSYQWTVPPALPSSNLYHIGVFETYRRKTRFKGEKFAVRKVYPIRITAPAEDGRVASGEMTHIEWTGGEQTADLNVYYSTDNGSTWRMTDSAIANDGAYAWTVPKLDCVSSIRLMVRDAHCSRPSDTVELETVSRPVLIPMGFPTTLKRPTLRWYRWCGEDAYTITIGASPLFDTDFLKINLTDTSFTPAAPLSPGTYYWRVTPLRTGTFPSRTDTIRIQDPGVPLPQKVDPNPTRERRVAFRWNPVDNAVSYRLVVADNPAFDSPILVVPLSDTVYKPTVDLPTGKVYWKVKSNINDTYSFPQSFLIVPDTIPLPYSIPGDTVATLRPSLKWRSVAQATNYTMRLYSSYPAGGEQPILDTTTSDTILQFEEDLHPGMYYWRVGSDRAPDVFSQIDSFYVIQPNNATAENLLSERTAPSVRIADGVLTVQYATAFGKPGRLSILTFGGRRVSTFELTASTTGWSVLSMPCPIPAGTYFVEMELGNVRLLKRLTVLK